MKSTLTSLALFLTAAGSAFAANSGSDNIYNFNNIGSYTGNGVGNGVGNGGNSTGNGVGNGNVTIITSIPWQVDGTNIILQNDSGQVYIWELNGNIIIGSANLGNPGASWHVLGTGDFYGKGNGQPDIFFQNNSGEVAIWEMNGTTVIGGGSLGNPGPSWQAVATGDFNGDGKSDVLWQSKAARSRPRR
jgi:hypothetical protein